MGWIEQVRDMETPEILGRFGARVWKNSCVCPLCKAEVRGSAEKRGPVGFTGNKMGWKCHRCGAKGGSIEMASFLILGRKAESQEDWKTIAEALESNGIISGDLRGGNEPPRRPRRRIPIATPEELFRPPADEIRATWEACGPVTKDAEVSEWLFTRGLHAKKLEEIDAVRALPAGFQEYPWITRATAWVRRAVTQVFDSKGDMVSLKFRTIKGDIKPKSVSPNGQSDTRTGGRSYAVKNSTLANRLGQRLLSGKSSGLERWDGRVLICEGEPDFLTLTQYGIDLKKESAIFGVWSGAWAMDLARRIPIGSIVVIKTDHDDSGNEYARKIAATLADRCDVRRG